MNKIERKIIRKVYLFETKKTAAELILRISSIVLMVIGGVFVGASLIRQLIEQRTLDLLILFQEDVQIIREFWRDVLETFYMEIPKTQLAILILCLIVFSLLVLFFTKNFVKIKNKMRSIISYWRRH